MISFTSELVEKAITRGLDEVEVYSVHTLTRLFSIVNDKVWESTVTEDYDIGLRGALGKRVGAIRLNALSIGVHEVLEKLYAVVKSSPEDPHWSGFPGAVGATSPVTCYDDKTAKMSEKELVESLKYTMEAFKAPALRRGVERTTITEGVLSVQEYEISIVNSHGVEKSTRCSGVLLWLVLSVAKGGYTADKTLFYSKRGLDLRELEKKAITEGELTLFFLGASALSSGVYDVVLAPTVAGELLEYSLAPAFSALNILEGRSRLKGKLGEVVFNDAVTLLDDPSLDLAMGTRPFDDEGIPTSRKPVVEKGVFRAVLHSYYTARRMGVSPTGNGIRQHAAASPTPRFTNLVLSPGKGSLEDFTRDVARGVVIYEVIGHWMSNPITGAVKATVTHGALVEAGNVVKPIKGVVIGGDIYEWLSSKLAGVGSDLEVIGTLATPSLWIRGVKVAGQ